MGTHAICRQASTVVVEPGSRAAIWYAEELEAAVEARGVECAWLAAQLARVRAENAALRGFLSIDAATSGPFQVWIAGYGDRPMTGYRRGDQVFVPGVCVVNEADVLHTEAAAA